MIVGFKSIDWVFVVGVVGMAVIGVFVVMFRVSFMFLLIEGLIVIRESLYMFEVVFVRLLMVRIFEVFVLIGLVLKVVVVLFGSLVIDKFSILENLVIGVVKILNVVFLLLYSV